MTAALNLNSLFIKIYISMPLLLAGNYALTYAFPGIKLRLKLRLIMVVKAIHRESNGSAGARTIALIAT